MTFREAVNRYVRGNHWAPMCARRIAEREKKTGGDTNGNSSLPTTLPRVWHLEAVNRIR